MNQEAKNRQVRFDDTKNNFFNTLTSGYQAFQGAANQYGKQSGVQGSTNPFAQPSNPYGQQSSGGYGQGNYAGNNYQSNFGGPSNGNQGAPYGTQGGPYGGQQQAGVFNSNMYPQFPQFPDYNQQQQPGYPQNPHQPGYPRGY